MKWTDRYDPRPEELEDVVITTEDNMVYRGTYAGGEVCCAKGMVPWNVVTGWMLAKDFPFPKEEYFE